MKVTRRSAFLLITLTLLAAAQLSAGVVTYNSRASFNAAAPGLPVEDFASLNPGTGQISTCDSPLHDSSCGGALLPGISYETQTGPSGIAITGPGFLGMPDVVAAFANTFTDTLTLRLTTPADAIGFNVYSLVSPSVIDIGIFDPNGGSLGSFQVTAGVNDVFFGAIDTSGDIGWVTLSSESGQAEGVTGVAFGTAQTTTPEPGTLLLLGSGLLGAIVRFRRR